MSEPNEPSYYEVALTRRQVTVAFVVLLVCMVASFLAGVWVARGAQPAAAAVAAAAPAADSVKLPEYKFFSDRSDRSEGAGPAATPAAAASAPPPPSLRPEAAADPDTTLLADVGGDPERPAVGAGADSESEPEAADATAGASNPEPAPVPSPAPPATTPPAVAPPAAASPEPGTVYRELQAGEMAVQVFSSNDERQARAILRQLKSAGYSVFLSPLATGDKRMFRVRVGPYTDRAAAQRVADEVTRRFKLETWIAK